MPTKLDEFEENSGNWFFVMIVVVVFAWATFIWLAWRAVSPYVSEFILAAGLSVILGFVGVCAAGFICMCLVMLAAVFVVPRRRRSEAG